MAQTAHGTYVRKRRQFAALIALTVALLIYPVRNANNQFNTLELKADANETAVGGPNASQQASITAGDEHTCALLSTGGMQCWGHNGHGQLGDGTATQRSTPTDVSGLSSGVTAITAGKRITCALLSTGGVKCWGGNNNGQNGDGTTTYKLTPTNVSGLSSGVTAITAGDYHTCALLSTGDMKCWGNNFQGQVGDGTTTRNGTYKLTPTNVSGLSSGVTAITAGAEHTCALLSTGGMQCWGSGGQGGLGDGTATQRSTPTDVSGLSSGVTAITAGFSHTCALLSTGGVKCWGYNSYGQLGDGTTTDKWTPTNVSGLSSGVTAITAGERHTCALLSTGGMQCWGGNNNYQLGDGTTTDKLTPTNVSGLSSGVTAITAGFAHTCALLSTGGMKCWGNNYYGQLGDGTTTYQLTPTNVSRVSGSSFGLDSTAPTFVSAAVNAAGTKVILTYSESLSATTAGASDFAVTVAGVSRTVSSVAVSGSTVELTLASVVGSGQAVTVAYTDPSGSNDANAVQDAAGNDAASLSATSVTNSSTVDQDAPTFVSAAVNAAGTKVILTYSESLSATTAASSAFAVTVGGVSRTVSSVAVSGSTVELTLASVVGSGQAVTVAYTDPSGSNDANAVQDAAGNDAASLSATSVTNSSTVDQDAPTFVSAAVNAAGTKVILTYSESLSATTAGASDFAVLVGGVSRSVSSVAVSGSTVELTLASVVATGQAVTVAYTDPSGSNDVNAVQDAAGNDVASLSATSVTNNADSVSPSFVSASTNADGTSVTLTFGEALSATTAAAGAFSVVVNGTAVTPSSATVSGSTVVLGLTPAVQSGDTVTFTYTDPTAGNDANAVQDSVGNDVASISATSVTNASTVDTRAPTFVSASTSTDGLTVTLTYSESLSATTAASSAFAVLVGGVSRTVSSVAVSGSTVVLTLASAVSAGASVTVAYTDPSGSNDANAVQDANGNDAATMAATSVTNSVPTPTTTTVPSGSGDGGGTPTTSTTTTTISTTSTSVPTATTSTTTVPRRTTTSTTIARRPAGATSTSSSTTSTPSTSTTVARVTTTTIFKPLAPLAPLLTIPTTTTTSSVVRSSVPLVSSTISTSTSSSAIVSTTSTSTTIARSVVNNLSTAEESLEVAKQSAGTSVLSAQIAVADLRLKLIDSKSAVAIAVKDAEKLVERLESTDASPEQIAQAEKRVVDLKIEVAEAKSISIEKILAAQEALQDVLADPRSTSVEIAKATAAFIDSRTPSFEEATKILSNADDDPTLPLVIKGVVDNPRIGSVVFFDDNDSKSIQVVTLNNSVVRLQSNEGFNLTISSRNTNGEPVALGSNGQILVKHDNKISISGQGFAPNSLAKTWLFSSPRELGEIIVNPDGTFAADHPIGNDIKVGLHTAQINGTSPDGEVRSLSISLEVVPNVGPAPFDPLSQPGKVLTLVAELVTLLAIAGASSGGGAGAGRRREEDEEDERESAEVAEVSAAFGSVGVDRDRDRLPVLVVDAVDRVSVGASRGVVGLSPMLARVLGDGVYLRSIMGVLWLVLPFVGAGFGFGAASSAGFDAVMPSLFWLSALVVLGAFDAFSGFVGAFVFSSAVGFGGGVVSGDSVRGLLGVWVFCFAAPLIAGAVRPFRRVRGGSTQIVWDRCVDFVLIVLFGAWVAGSMYSALPGLTGFNSPSAGYVNHVRLVVLVALTIRFVLENFAVAVTPVRLKALTREPLPEPTLQQQISSAIVRTGVYMFVAVVFIGNNWALWLGGVLYLVPKLVSLGVDKLPDMRTVHRYLPRGIFKVVLMLFVAKWWGSIVAAQVDNPADMIKFGFVLLGIPGLALGAVGWFARSSRPWPSTIVTKLLGLVLLVVGVLVVLNIWLAI